MAEDPVIAFDSAAYDKLIAFLADSQKVLDTNVLAATSDLMLNDGLGDSLRIGSSDWDVVKAVIREANRFGGNVRTTATALDTEWGTFGQALTAAKTTLGDSDDLATMSASEFLTKYPGLAPPTTTPPPTGAPPPSGSA